MKHFLLRLQTLIIGDWLKNYRATLSSNQKLNQRARTGFPALRFSCMYLGTSFDRSPSLGACNYSIFLSRRFHRPIYMLSLNLSRIQIPTGTSVTNCSPKHELMLTCQHDFGMFTVDRIVLSLPKRAHVD